MKQNNHLLNHIAVIPDGNRRWAKKHKLDAWLGHKKGTEKLESFMEIMIENKIRHLSFWGSSKDNLKKRPKGEVVYLLKLFKEKFAELAKKELIHRNGIKVSIIGDWEEQFPAEVKKEMRKAIEATKDYSSYFLNFFIAYSGTSEILHAINCIAKKAIENPNLEIDGNLLKSCLLTRDLPPVDLMIRSGGEPHLSDGFMMWDAANSQLFFSKKLWPDFGKSDFKKAIEEYFIRERRFGE